MDPVQQIEAAEVPQGDETGNNSKLMTLDDARQELERQGMSCDFMTDHLLVGVMSECRLEITGKMDVLVFVQQVPGALTLDRLLADLQVLPSWVDQHHDGGSCPPFGAARARQVMLVYYAETIAPEVTYEIVLRTPKREWCSTTFLAAQDEQGKSYYLDEDQTPFWGRAFYPELRYRAKTLTGCPTEKSRPPGLACWLKFVNVFSIFYIIFLSFSTPQVLLIVTGLVLLQFLIAAIIQWFKKRKQQNTGNGLLQFEAGGGGVDNEFHVL